MEERTVPEKEKTKRNERVPLETRERYRRSMYHTKAPLMMEGVAK